MDHIRVYNRLVIIHKKELQPIYEKHQKEMNKDQKMAFETLLNVLTFAEGAFS